MTEETWLPVVGFEGQYEVSDQGRVRSLDRPVQCPGHAGQKPYVRVIPGKLIKLTSSPYLAVYLPRQGATRVHVLVAAAFLGPRPEGWETRHLNGNPLDNRAANLAYGTVAENQQDRIRHGRGKAQMTTHCIHGHEYTEENTYRYEKDGQRIRRCKACTTARALQRRRERDALKPPPEPFPHGTVRGYRRGCHCDECRAANTAYARQMRERSA